MLKIMTFFVHSTIFRILKASVRKAIGPIATPDFIVYCDLPKVSKEHAKK